MSESPQHDLPPEPEDYETEEFPPRGRSNGAGTPIAGDSYAPPPWPVMDPSAYHGLAGEVVSTILPHTEADPVALLLQFLASFGNAGGRGRHYQVEQTWDGRERLQTLTKHSPTKATNAHISIVAHITVEELRRMLDETAMANGFANRFLFACVKRSKVLPFGGALPPETITRLGEATRIAIQAAQRTDAITMSEPAQALWCKHYAELSSGSEGLLAHITSRAEAQTVRLALVYALLDQAEAINLAHLEAGLAVWQYCEASARHIFGDILGDPVADLILETLRRDANGMSRRDISQLFSNHVPADTIGKALGQLLRAGKVRREMQPTSGRPREMWFAI